MPSADPLKSSPASSACELGRAPESAEWKWWWTEAVRTGPHGSWPCLAAVPSACRRLLGSFQTRPPVRQNGQWTFLPFVFTYFFFFIPRKTLKNCLINQAEGYFEIIIFSCKYLWISTLRTILNWIAAVCNCTFHSFLYKGPHSGSRAGACCRARSHSEPSALVGRLPGGAESLPVLGPLSGPEFSPFGGSWISWDQYCFLRRQ